jgi:hypothetical protein
VDLIEPAGDVVPRRTLHGRLVAVLAAPGGDDLTSVAVEELRLDLGGAPGDRHFGFTRKSGSREPWYPRGTEIRSGRQVSIVSVEALAEVALRIELLGLPPAWIGANLVVSGIPRLSLLPPGTRMFLVGDAAVVVEAINGPCRDAGRSIARHLGGRDDLELLFPKVALGLRGVVASVERAGTVTAGTDVSVRIPEQRLYR